MRKSTMLTIVLLLLLLPLPLGVLLGFFFDYSDTANRSWLWFHPGFYYHHGVAGYAPGVVSFRGGGPGFGK